MVFSYYNKQDVNSFECWTTVKYNSVASNIYSQNTGLLSFPIIASVIYNQLYKKKKKTIPKFYLIMVKYNRITVADFLSEGIYAWYQSEWKLTTQVEKLI